MFTITQIHTAHSKVRSGADFPAYIKEIKQMGVNHYKTYVSDGHTDYFSSDNEKVTSPAKYAELAVAEDTDAKQFKIDLKAHQHGETDYLTFIESCASLGVEKWEVCMEKMTCTYFDKSGKEILVEQIPQ
jgi:uncharacterized protein YbcV (DUF1398 family)